MRGPGEPLHVTQTEVVEYKLDGLVLLIQGTSTDATGKPVFQALATVSYDDASSTYRFRAYNDGRYLDQPLTVSADGFAWGYSAGPVQVSNTMRLSPDGEWKEITTSAYGGASARSVADMTLKHISAAMAKQP